MRCQESIGIGTETQVSYWYYYQNISKYNFHTSLFKGFSLLTSTSVQLLVSDLFHSTHISYLISLSYPQGYQAVRSETKTRKKGALTPTATFSLAQETPPTHHLTVSTGKFPPHVPRSLPSHVLFHVVTPSSVHSQHKSFALKRAGRTTVEQTKIQMAAPDSSHLHLHSLPLVFCDTQKCLMAPPLCASDGLRRAFTPAFRAHGFHG